MAFSGYITDMDPKMNETCTKNQMNTSITCHQVIARAQYWNGLQVTQQFFRGSSIIFLPLFITNNQDRDTFHSRGSLSKLPKRGRVARIQETHLRTLKFYKVPTSLHTWSISNMQKYRVELHSQALRPVLSKYFLAQGRSCSDRLALRIKSALTKKQAALLSCNQSSFGVTGLETKLDTCIVYNSIHSWICIWLSCCPMQLWAHKWHCRGSLSGSSSVGMKSM